MLPVLQTHDLKAFYGDAQALFGVSVEVNAGEVVAVIGANGAGKSTLLKATTGLLRVEHEAVSVGGYPVGGTHPSAIARAGVALVPEGRRLFPSLSVEENLMLGGTVRRAGPWNLRSVYRLFPILEEKKDAPSTSLSGGQQQMVALGRALMSNPKVLLCDELSLGLAPIVVKEIYDAMPQFTADGMSVLIVEQDVSVAQRVSSRLYCFQEGRVTLQGPSKDFTKAQISAAYFGV